MGSVIVGGVGFVLALVFIVLNSCSSFSLYLSLDKGPLRLATGSKCCLHVYWFFLFSLCFGWNPQGLFLYGSDDSQYVLQWVVGVEQEILVCVSGFSIHSNIEAVILISGQNTVQERQSLGLGKNSGELDVVSTIVHMLRESLNSLGFDFDPCVPHISEPVAGSFPSEGAQSQSSISSM